MYPAAMIAEDPMIEYAVSRALTDSALADHRALCESSVGLAEARSHFERSLEAARSGSPLAMVVVARCFAAGFGVARSPESAEKWATEACSKGFAPAFFLRAHLLPQSDRDSSEARSLLEQSAEGGFTPATLELADAWLDGRFGTSDLNKHADYLVLAAGAGHPGSAMELAQAYEEGRGVSQDFLLARRWYEQAAELGYAMACSRLSMA